ncbi:DNA binding zinc ion binding DNA binding putative isoform 3 [Tripterygium wilfordii]|uniref:DNA binding zinc ion binding DNA binding putative isoform 3 n=1 Tax=Tripterygium wilfordii TaxID=458696 RepID=A0A7J7C9R4_TRIWF|nr:DDT domain-containing protein PTM-like [Tripterygium wilfordii]KAF5730840.1 DNA binding zinc ion binding DNA binding putative isoform 3 [Tripterygium wilfordii]
MEYVGKTLKKEFAGFGVFSGIVKSYDSASGLFEIVYEDGDSEELELAEMASLLGVAPSLAQAQEAVEYRGRLGRKSKKRRRVELGKGVTSESGNSQLCGNVDLNGGVGALLEKGSEFDRNFSASVSLSEGDTNLDRNVGLNDGGHNSEHKFDLNAASFDLNVTDEDDLGDGVNLNNDFQQGLEKGKCFDLNSNVNPEMEENLKEVSLEGNLKKRKCGFDLNLGADEELKDDAIDNCGGQVKESTGIEVAEGTLKVEGEPSSEIEGVDARGGIIDGTLIEVYVSEDFHRGLVDRNQVEGGISVVDVKVTESVSLLEVNGLNGYHTLNDENQEDVGSGNGWASSRRKRRKRSDNLNATAERVLRRSARRGSGRYDVQEIAPSIVVNDLSATVVGAVTEEKPLISSGERADDPTFLPPKLQLPPSSGHLILEGMPILELFSVYSCLRTFSTLLFLSPFELEDFVAALNCRFPTPLFDCIHVSILQILRKQLEYLSNEGSQSASDCLRNQNWELLDMITWPIFMVEYLLICGSGCKPEFSISDLKPFECDYYKQPVSIKVKILQYLCDDMMEVEVIRSELSRRSLAAETDVDFDRNEVHKKKRVSVEVSGVSCLTEEVVNDTTDWNIDECCLCKMDGNLICCDGCPAAYHSKCVGVASDSLPEGEWYCPECAIERHKPWMKLRKSLRGGELLGIDPYGRSYFSCCSYLLVSDSCENEPLSNYYHRDDLNVVVDVLKVSERLYSSILKAIYRLWDIHIRSDGANGNMDSGTQNVCSDRCTPETFPVKNDTPNARKTEQKFVPDTEVSRSVRFHSEDAVEIRYVSSEGSVETTQTSSGIANIKTERPGICSMSVEISNQTELPGKFPYLEDNSLSSSVLNIKGDVNVVSMSPVPPLSEKQRTGDTQQVQSGTGYVNSYSFAHVASSVAEELLHKSSDKISQEFMKSEEEVFSSQMTAIWKKWMKFCWSGVRNLSVNVQKEKCGWCFYCKAPTDDSDCLFNLNPGILKEESRSELVGFHSKKERNGHLTDVIYHILSIEERLQGLLLGPWLNLHYSKVWHKNVLRASDIVSAKHVLLTLESNLRPLVLSPEWFKHVDSMVTMGSASHDVTASLRSSSKHGVGRKRGRCSDLEVNPSSRSAGGLVMFWRRGGKLSRQLYNWKVLPRSMVSRAARQAGCTKIPGILYPESTDFSRRSKCIAWRASVESSTSVEQLALRVRELDSIIRWDEIENTHPLSKLDKEFKKSVRLFKKVVIRRKCIEGEGLKYLLDFGKRKTIPDVIVKNGSMIAESSSGRKKYWLNESFVPLYLLKSFEEKRIARNSGNMSSQRVSEAFRVVKMPSTERGFQYLFSKAERSEYYQCGHCNKDVLIREAVCCQYCNGYFHRRHVRKSAGAVTAEYTYTCHRCHGGNCVKTDARTGKKATKGRKKNTESMKPKPQDGKKSSRECRSVKLKDGKNASSRPVKSQKYKKIGAGITLRRSPRKLKYVPVQNKKRRVCNKGKQVRSRRGNFKESKKVTSWRKKRTQAYYSYWVNGLQLARKPDDEKLMVFRSKRFLAPSENMTVNLDQHKCRLCGGGGYTSTSNYVACEHCGEWFHGEAFGLNAENVSLLIGFRCHACLKRTSPVCPHMRNMGIKGSQLGVGQNAIGCSEEECNIVPPLIEVNSGNRSLANEDLQVSLSFDGCSANEEQLSCALDSNQRLTSESKLEAENGHALVVHKQQNPDTTEITKEDLKPDLLTMSDKNLLQEVETIKKGLDDFETSDNKVQVPSSKIALDVVDAKVAVMEHDRAKDDLSSILKLASD